MSASHGCIDDKDVVESFTDALKQRIGTERFRVWFTHGVAFAFEPSAGADADTPQVTYGRIKVSVRGQFALDRLRKNFVQEMRGAAMQALGRPTDVVLGLANSPASQIELPLQSDDQTAQSSPSAPTRQRAQVTATQSVSPARSPVARARRAEDQSRSEAGKAAQAADSNQPLLPNLVCTASNSPAPAAADASSRGYSPWSLTLDSFVTGSCNQLACTAVNMACQDPGSATPLFLSGPTGVGKSHLLAAIADQMRRRHRMRRVIHLSAESFTNDFIASVGNSGLPAFRRRYRDVDALLIDDVQFLGAKRATLREMLYTVETLCDAGRPLIFSGSHAPTEITGLTQELAGRLAAGLVCPVQPLCPATRETLLRRAIESRCQIDWSDQMIAEINAMVSGDGRVILGVVNLVATLQQMFGRMPTLDEIHQYGGQLLRSSKPAVTLSVIERAVAQIFQLPAETLRSGAKTRSVTEPRMLAMYLSRELTSSAFSEIGRHYGGRSHSTAIVASQRVQQWLSSGKTIGRGAATMSTREALDRVESILRAS